MKLDDKELVVHTPRGTHQCSSYDLAAPPYTLSNNGNGIEVTYLSGDVAETTPDL